MADIINHYHGEKKINIIQLFFFPLIICSSLFPWYSNWTYRQAITNNPAIGGDLTNFPLLVVISNSSDLSTYASNSGDDIVFTLAANDNKLMHEIEYYNTGTIIAWIKIPYFSVTEQSSNILYMYFDKTKPGNQQNKTGVWSEHYSGVWHLSENTGSAVLDSTINTNHGSPTNKHTVLDYPGTVSGKIGEGLDFIHINSNVVLHSTAGSGDITAPAITLQAWIKYSGAEIPTNGRRAIASKYPSGNAYFLDLVDDSGNEGYRLWINATSCKYNSALSADWVNLCGVYNGTDIRLYLNGICVKTNAKAGDIPLSTETFKIGTFQNNYFDGIIDEVKLSSNVKSANWIASEFSNQINPVAFRTLGIIEVFSGVIFSSMSPAVTPCISGENTVFNLNARVLSGTIILVNINWGDGQANSYSPCVMDISTELFSHIYTARSNFTVTAVVTSSSGIAATNNTFISTLPFRIYQPYDISFINEPRGCLVKWNITSSANVDHYNLYRGNDLHARIENPSLREYLDECIIFGDSHSYWMEAVYSAGSAFSVTNFSQPHVIYRAETNIGASGENLDTLIARLFIPKESLTGTCTLSMSILSNTHASFYESGKPVYQQIEIASPDITNKIFGSMALKFRIPAVNNSLVFRPFEADGYTISHKNKLFCSIWDGKTWTALSTAINEHRYRNKFNFLELKISINRLGIYGVMYNPQNAIEEVVVKNRLFVPGLNNPALSSVQISFPNPDRAQVKILIFDINGKLVKKTDYTEWISFWSWNGIGKNGKIVDPGLYIVSIITGDIKAEVINAHTYLLK